VISFHKQDQCDVTSL